MKNTARSAALFALALSLTSCGLIGGDDDNASEQPTVGQQQTIEGNGVRYELKLDKVEDVTGSIPADDLPDSAKAGSVFFVHYTVKRPDAKKVFSSVVSEWTGTATDAEVKVRRVVTIMGDYPGCEDLTAQSTKQKEALEFRACAPLVTDRKTSLTEVGAGVPRVYMQRKGEERPGKWWKVTPTKASAPAASS